MQYSRWFLKIFLKAVELIYVGCHSKVIMKEHRIFSTSFADVYPLYLAKVVKKGRTQAELNTVICWLTGYTPEDLKTQLHARTDFRTFFADAPLLNPNRTLVTGVICGVRIEEIQSPLMQEIRRLDKLVDELAKGRVMDKILRR